MKNTLLVDGDFILNKSFYTKHNSQALIKRNKHALVNFVKTVLNLERYNNVGKTVVFFDGRNGSNARKSILSAYKSSRNKHQECEEKSREQKLMYKQKVFIYNFLKRLIPIYGNTDLEGDDLIASYVKRIGQENIIIATGDQDMFQLINKKTSVLYMVNTIKNTYNNKLVESYNKNNGYILLTHKNFMDYFNYHYSNIMVKKVFCGDKSDDVPNVKALSEKKFISLFPMLNQANVKIESIINYSKLKCDIDENPDIKYKRIVEYSSTDFFDINKRIVDLSQPFENQDSISEIKSISNVKNKNLTNCGTLFENKLHEFNIYNFF